MAVTRTFYTSETAGIGNNEPTRPGSYYANAWATYWGTMKYALVRFPELSNIPATATIQSAKLRWRMYDAGDPNYERAGAATLSIRANRITSDWQRSSVTWNTQPGFDATDAPTLTDKFNQPGQYTPWWDVTAHVAGIVAGAYPNYGWLMQVMYYSGGVAFYNWYDWRDYPAELEVTYIAPAEVTIDGPAGAEDNPAEITDRVSGFELTASVTSPGGEPISRITAQVYDVDGNQAWESALVYNQLSANQQSVETDTSGFATVNGASISRVSTRAWHGAASLRVIGAASAGSGARIASGPALIAEPYSARAMVSGAFGKTLEMQLQAVDGGGAVLSAGALRRTLLGNTSLTGCSQTEAKSWTEFIVENVTAVADTAEMRIEVTSTDATAPTFYLDGNVLTPAEELAHWTGDDTARFPIPLNMLEYGRLYSWRVMAENTAGSSGWSAHEYFMCLLSAVTGLSAEGTPDEALIRLSWDAHPGESLAGYRVYRAPAGEPLVLHSIDLVGAEALDDDAAENGMAYDYRIAAVAADGYEGPQSALKSASVAFAGNWLGSLRVLPRVAPHITRPRLASHRVALDGSLVSQDYGFGAREMELQLQYLSKADKQNLYALLTPASVLSYRDAKGEVFRGRLASAVREQPYPTPGRMTGLLNVRFVEVLPRD